MGVRSLKEQRTTLAAAMNTPLSQCHASLGTTQCSAAFPNTHTVHNLTRFNKIAIQGAPQMAVDKEATHTILNVTCHYSMCNLP